MASFNPEQLQAIAARSNEDILIAAGAGSGKTKTLSERVFELVSSGEVAPEGLLVLTFTNNAAHEMKTRILSRFGVDHPLYARMLSSHVQSFDSFNAYLLRKYAGHLGVAPSFTILSDTFLTQKKAEAVDQVLNEAYQDPLLKKRLFSFMSDLGLKEDKVLKESILELLQSIKKIAPNKKSAFLRDCLDYFLSEDFAKKAYADVVSSAKKELALILRRAYICDRLSQYEFEGPRGYERLQSVLEDRSLYDNPLEAYSLLSDSSKEGREDFLNDEYREMVTMLSLADEEFVEAAKKMLEEHGEDYLASIYPGSRKKDATEALRHVETFKELKKAKDLFRSLASLEDLPEEAKRLRRYEDGIALMLDLAENVGAMLDEYRFSHNAFAFDDVSSLVLSLFVDERHADVAEEIRTRFTYVMVDEYQDTNDFQELFIDCLLKPNKEGKRSHLFCVGDAKQSIYAFRGSNVGLFKARQRSYLVGEGHRVIAMNKNYRSAKKLLQDINHIFSFYMKPDMGGIDYLDPLERLTYDDKVNLYHESLQGYGVHRILPPQSLRLGKKGVGQVFLDAEYEARAILSDIQEKLRSGFRVFDRGLGKSRPCKTSDFCILVRRKKNVRIYQKLFNENGIRLNNKTSVDLRSVNAVLLLQSLLDLLGHELGYEDERFLHHYASVARSYVYRYSDEKLHGILSCDEEKRAELLQKDEIMQDLRRFCEEHQNDGFRALFLALLEEFHVIERLYLIGDVEDNIAKIESLYALLCTGETLGHGLKEFIELFHDIGKRRLEISTDTLVESIDAVDFMTIHASKGLERKIVYLPSSDNGVGQSNNAKSALFSMGEDFGIAFPFVDLPEDGLLSMEGQESFLTLALREQTLHSLRMEEQEHVRLLYVALTRAENALYLVGRNKGRRSAYVMMASLPSKMKVHPAILGNANPSSAQLLEQLNAVALSEPLSLSEDVFPAYEGVRKEKVLDELKKQRKEALIALLSEALQSYAERFAPLLEDADEVATLFGAAYFPAQRKSIHSLADLRRIANSSFKDEEEEDEEEEIEEEQEKENEPSLLQEDVDQALKGFAQALRDLNASLLCPSVKKDEEKTLLIDALLLPLAQYFDDVDYAFYESYQDEDYEDCVYFYDDASWNGVSATKEPKLCALSLDDRAIDFPRVESKRASKQASDEDLPSEEILERGNKLHRYLELYRFDGNLDYIASDKDRSLILRVLDTPLMKEAQASPQRYQEYGYYDEENLTTGFIDLFYVKDGVYHIVDYKSSSIDDPAYVEQLHAYGRALMRLFHVEKEKVRLHLLSIGKAQVRDVD